mgnify:CR=1 FL=1
MTEKNSIANCIVGNTERDTRNKRNAFQKAIDKKLAVELLSQGKTYRQISKIIGEQRSYSLSHEQIRKDVTQIEEQVLSSAIQHGLQSITQELDQIECVQTDISARLALFAKDDHKAIPLLKLLTDLASRRTYLTGGDSYIRSFDLTNSIERVTRAGFVVSDTLNREEPIDIQAEAVMVDD